MKPPLQDVILMAGFGDVLVNLPRTREYFRDQRDFYAFRSGGSLSWTTFSKEELQCSDVRFLENLYVLYPVVLRLETVEREPMSRSGVSCAIESQCPDLVYRLSLFGLVYLQVGMVSNTDSEQDIISQAFWVKQW